MGVKPLSSAPAGSARKRGHIRGKEYEMKTLIKMLKDDSGASAAEYALILAIVGSGIAIASLILGGAIGNAMNSASNCINLATTAACN
jgi:pilus assembly protein Flp/PilA